MNREVTSPSISSERYPTFQTFVEMFRRNVQNPVWIHHIAVHTVVHQYGGLKECKQKPQLFKRYLALSNG